jgi:transcription initiation factor IIE alpha subunit
MRLACLYALLDFSCFVRPEHLKAALALWEYCEASCQYIFGDSLGDPVADEILRELRKSPEGLTGTDISNLFGRNKNANQLSRALFLLMENGLVRKESKETKEGGRPAVLWVAI